MTKKEIINKINELTNPFTNKKVEFDKVVKKIEIDDDSIIINFEKLGKDDNINKIFNRSLLKLLKIDLGFKSVKIEHPEIRIDHSHEQLINKNTKIIAIMSGKGGVGKSQVTCNTAKALVDLGYKVGIMDADIYGFSVPKILDLYEIPKVQDEEILPVLSKEGIEVISAQYFLEDNANEAIIWRASMVNQLMNHFFYDVKWSQDLDYLLIDLPPGTGDICLNVSQNLKDVKALLVTTPNSDAAHVALRSGLMANSVGFKTIGIIENMSYYNHNGEKLYIFGKGGTKEVSETLNVPIISEIPIETDVDKLAVNYTQIVMEIEAYYED